MSFTDIEIEDNSDFLKFKSGEVVTFRILSQTPDKTVVHWIDKKKASCTGAKTCEYCAQGDKPKQRWQCEVWDRKSQSVKKIEFGAMIAGQMKAIAEMLAESQATIHTVDIRVKTTGSNLETEYSVLHVPSNGTIPTDIMEKFEVPF